MNKRTELAIEILKNGGYFRKQLETQYRGGEKFHTRLRNANRQIVKGVGFQTWAELEDSGMLQRRECLSSSVWPEEWVLREGVAA